MKSLPRKLALIGVLILTVSTACGDDQTDSPTASSSDADSQACAPDRTLRFGFYAFYEPVSYSADPDPDAPGFGEHRGYEADLLTALESMEGAGLRFDRSPIAEWPEIWLQPAGPDFDIVGGGMTILSSRTYDQDGNQVVAFTSGHITFRQSLLVRSEDAERYATHDDLTSDVRVGVMRSTTGEGRLLLLTGLTDAEGRLAEGTRVVTDTETLVADGSDRFVITPAGSSANLKSRSLLEPPSPDMPVVVYLEDTATEDDMQEAVRSGVIDAYASEEIGNLEAVHSQPDDGVFSVTAHDTEVELGGWALSVDDQDLIACLNAKLDYLTDDLSIGFAEWQADPQVFLRRAGEFGS